MRAAIYARVSPSNEKSEENETIGDQVEKLRKQIAKNGDSLIEIYQDEGYTGKAERRPDFDRLLDDAKLGKFDAVYFTKVDRLARSEGARVYCLKSLKKLGIKVYIGGEIIDETPEGKLMLKMLGSFAEYEAEQIVLRTTNGRWRQARAGKIIASKTRFGYKLEWINGKKEVVIDENEAKVVLYIYDLIFQKRSCFQVAKQLFDEGIKTRHGKNWDASTIKRILSDKTYTGVWHYGKRLAAEPKKKRKTYYTTINSSTIANPDKDSIIYYKIPAIISQGKFDAVQEVLKEIGKRRIGTKRFYLLNGILRCSKCGGKMYGRTLKDKRYNKYYLYYYCSTNSKFPFHQKTQCPTRQVRGKEIETTVWKAVRDLFQHPEEIMACQKAYLKENDSQGKIVEEKKSLLAELDKIRQNKVKLLELYEAGDIEKSLIKDRLNSWAGREQDINRKIEIIEKSASTTETNKHVVENLQKYGEAIRIGLGILTPEERKELIMGMLVSIDFNPDNRGINIIGSLRGLTGGFLHEKVEHLKSLNHYLQDNKEAYFSINVPVLY